MTFIRYIRVIRKTSDNIQNHQEKTCMKHKLKDVLTHYISNLTVKKVIK